MCIHICQVQRAPNSGQDPNPKDNLHVRYSMLLLEIIMIPEVIFPYVTYSGVVLPK